MGSDGKASRANPARLFFPALRWDGTEYRAEGCSLDEALEVGVGGFILFGGSATAAKELVTECDARSRDPLLFASDLERGAGQQFAGCSPLPPAAALGFLGDEVVRRAAALTTSEAGDVGVRWLFAPVADLGFERANPIVGTRAFGYGAPKVSGAVRAWVMGSLESGGLPCVKHFPGHGRTTVDSHKELPKVSDGRDALADDLAPFQEAVHAGVPSVMTAHVAYPAMDPAGRPATRSSAIIEGVLRAQLGFEGVVVTDALIMDGIRSEAGRLDPETECLLAGVDALLYPPDLPTALGRITRVVEEDEWAAARVNASVRRLDLLRARAAGSAAPSSSGGAGWAEGVAERAVAWARADGWAGRIEVGGAVEVVVVDDDVGGPYPPPSRDGFSSELERLGVTALGADPSSDEALVDGRRAEAIPRIVALYCDPRGWKGRAGPSERSIAEIRRSLRGPEDLVLLFGDPRITSIVPEPNAVLCAWGGEALMQRAAARALMSGSAKATLNEGLT